MQLRFVGCGDALGSGGRFNTCFHVTGERANFLIDCGASSLVALKQSRHSRATAIDVVLITHFHGDHFAGLPFLLLDAQFTRAYPAAGDRRPGRDRNAADAGDGGAVRAFVEDPKQKFDLSIVALSPNRRRTSAR